MPCKIELPEIKVKLQKYSFLSEAFHEAFEQVFRLEGSSGDNASSFPELAEVARYGYKNYATLGFAALYSNLTVEDDEEQTQENRGTLHEAASSLLPETFLAHVFKGLMGINEKYDFMNLREIIEGCSSRLRTSGLQKAVGPGFGLGRQDLPRHSDLCFDVT